MKPGPGWLKLLMLALLMTALSGCASRLEIGAPPRLERLATLAPYISTGNDVLLALGEPRGYGAARLRPDLDRQKVWMYEHSVSEGTDIRITMLLVFFSGDYYEGYMWFADNVILERYPDSGSRK